MFKAKSPGWVQAAAVGWDKFWFAAVTFGLLTFTNINPVFVILGAAARGWVAYR